MELCWVRKRVLEQQCTAWSTTLIVHIPNFSYITGSAKALVTYCKIGKDYKTKAEMKEVE